MSIGTNAENLVAWLLKSGYDAEATMGQPGFSLKQRTLNTTIATFSIFRMFRHDVWCLQVRRRMAGIFAVRPENRRIKVELIIIQRSQCGARMA
jgi:hypothetical protein